MWQELLQVPGYLLSEWHPSSPDGLVARQRLLPPEQRTNVRFKDAKCKKQWQWWKPGTFERRDSWDSNMCSSSELSISSSMPVIFPARLACMAWISGKRRSPNKIVNPISTLLTWWHYFGVITQHLFLLLRGGSSQHGGREWLLSLNVHCWLGLDRKKSTRMQWQSGHWFGQKLDDETGIVFTPAGGRSAAPPEGWGSAHRWHICRVAHCGGQGPPWRCEEP